MEQGGAVAAEERRMKDCGYGCGMRVVWAPLAGTGKMRTFNPEWCTVEADVWVLRRGHGMVSCSQLSNEQLAVLREREVRGWRLHTCEEYNPHIRDFRMPGKVDPW